MHKPCQSPCLGCSTRGVQHALLFSALASRRAYHRGTYSQTRASVHLPVPRTRKSLTPQSDELGLITDWCCDAAIDSIATDGSTTVPHTFPDSQSGRTLAHGRLLRLRLRRSLAVREVRSVDGRKRTWDSLREDAGVAAGLPRRAASGSAACECGGKRQQRNARETIGHRRAASSFCAVLLCSVSAEPISLVAA